MRKGLIAVSGIIALLLVACSSTQPSSSSTQPSNSNHGNVSKSAELPVVTIGEAVKIVTGTPISVAIKKGYFTKHGVSVKTESLSGSSAAISAMTAGSIQFSFASASSLLLAVSHDVPLTAISAFDQGIPLQLVVSKKWISSHHLSATAPLKERMQGLEGSTLVSTGSTSFTFMKLLMKTYGIPINSVKFVAVSSESASLAALQHGLADEIFESPPLSVEAVDRGIGIVWLQPDKVNPLFKSAYDIVITTTPKYLKAHKATVQAVAAGLADGINYVIDHPADAADIEHSSVFPNTSLPTIRSSLAVIPYVQNGAQNSSGWNSTVRLLESSGQLKKSVSPAGHWISVK